MNGMPVFFWIVWEYGNVLFVKSNLPIMLNDSLMIILEVLCFVVVFVYVHMIQLPV